MKPDPMNDLPLKLDAKTVGRLEHALDAFDPGWCYDPDAGTLRLDAPGEMLRERMKAIRSCLPDGWIVDVTFSQDDVVAELTFVNAAELARQILRGLDECECRVLVATIERAVLTLPDAECDGPVDMRLRGVLEQLRRAT